MTIRRWYNNGGQVTHQAFLELSEDKQNEIIRYLQSLPVNLSVNASDREYLLVHGSPMSCFSRNDVKYLDAIEYSVWERIQVNMDSWFYAKLPAAEKKKLRQGYPRKQWHGGFVRELRPSVLMLERGYIFVIDGKYCFAFGGAGSHDIQDGILDPACFQDEASFKEAYKAKRGQMFRVRGISWWDEEMPSLEEMERGRRTLQAFTEKQGTIDLVFTHDAPASDKLYMGYSEIDELSRFLESLKDVMHYGKWFYGHLHDNRRVFENHYLLYEQIVQIG